jgi:eukaryotic-like serine/threonine-protein kinase
MFSGAKLVFVASRSPQRVGRYELHQAIGAGGMATVHFGRLEAVGGFSRVVAIKRLHPQIAANRELAARFFEEAKLATRVRHANVVPTIDVALDGEAGLVVMEYVQGETLGKLLQVACQSDEPPPPPVVSAILSGALHGLHAAHQAKNERGEPLRIVHRDVSPQNILVGSDGVARVLDFGIAKATAQTSVTPGIQLKGKAAYMAPEQLRAGALTPSTDVFATAIVLWESLVGRRLFLDETEAKTLSNVLSMPIEPPSAFVPSLSPEVDAVVLRGLERDPANRFQSARDMAVALERAVVPASTAEVGAWVEGLAPEALASRAKALREVETWSGLEPTPEGLEPEGARARSSSPRRVRAVQVAVSLVLFALGVGSIAVALRGPERVASSAPGRHLVPSSVHEEVPSATAPSDPPVAAAVRAERVTGKRPHMAKMSPPPSECSPPYTYNAAGHKVFKPQCL